MAFENATLTLEQKTRFEALIASWQDASNTRLMKQYGHFVNQDVCRYAVGRKYVSLTIGNLIAFMVNIKTGVVYGLNVYDRPNLEKVCGNVYHPDFAGDILIRDRFRRGPFENEPDGRAR